MRNLKDMHRERQLHCDQANWLLSNTEAWSTRRLDDRMTECHKATNHTMRHWDLNVQRDRRSVPPAPKANSLPTIVLYMSLERG